MVLSSLVDVGWIDLVGWVWPGGDVGWSDICVPVDYSS